jgi:hypothetical protein
MRDTQAQTSVVASSQHTDPWERSAQHTPWVAPIDWGIRGEGSGTVRRTLNYSTTVES